MAKKRPAEFPSDWHWEQHERDLKRALDGANYRLLEAESLDDLNPEKARLVADAKAEIEEANRQLAHYGWGPKAASRRPRAEKKETR